MLRDRIQSVGQALVTVLPLLGIALTGLVLLATYNGISLGADAPPTPLALAPTMTPTATALPTVTRTPTATRIPATPPPTTQAGGNRFQITPAPNQLGWVSSNEERVAHFGDDNLNSGIFSGTVYYALLQFDLSSIAAGTQIHFAAVELTGLKKERLGSGGHWQLQMLADVNDTRWNNLTYAQVRALPLAAAVGEPLTANDLAAGKTNVLTFGPEQMAELEKRLASGRVSFRLDGPTAGSNDLFTWDAGQSQGGLGLKPVLRIDTGPLAPTATPTWVVVTSTPTPRNEATARARAATATYVATALGTDTPVPGNWVTPVVVTNTPEPANVFAAATQSARITLDATRFGTDTPTPVNWVTPIVVTPTPLPGNAATATYLAAQAAAQAATTGTATPFPFNVMVATVTPRPTATALFVPFTPAPDLPTATPTPSALPPSVMGKIAFMSNREGSAQRYLMDADGSQVARLTGPWIYTFALTRDQQTASGAYRLSVSGDLIRGTRIILIGPPQSPQTLFENSAVNYDPAFAPDGYHIAFVSTITGHDEIYSLTRDRADLRQLTFTNWEFNKHPSWSPDGKQIIWWSNRETGHHQLWLMNADGSQPINLSNNTYDDWDPVWIK